MQEMDAIAKISCYFSTV